MALLCDSFYIGPYCYNPPSNPLPHSSTHLFTHLPTTNLDRPCNGSPRDARSQRRCLTIGQSSATTNSRVTLHVVLHDAHLWYRRRITADRGNTVASQRHSFDNQGQVVIALMIICDQLNDDARADNQRTSICRPSRCRLHILSSIQYLLQHGFNSRSRSCQVVRVRSPEVLLLSHM